jgi:ADP-ribose pyrophosphatase
MEVDPPPEEIMSTTIIHQGKVLRFDKLAVKLPSGRIYAREIVEHPGAVTLIPIIGDKVVLVRQFRLSAGKVIYELPAGTISSGESPEACAEREIAEETGYRAGELKKVFQCYLAPGYSTELMHFYLATGLVTGKQNLDEDEVIRVCPTQLKDAFDMVKRNEIIDAKTTVGLLLYEGFGRSL